MNDLITAFWGTGWRKFFTSFLTTITATATAIVAVPPAWEAMGLPEAASRAFVTAHVQKTIDPMLQTESKLLVAQAQTTAALNQILLTQLQSSLYAAQQDSAASTSPIVQQRIADLKRQIEILQTTATGSR